MTSMIPESIIQKIMLYNSHPIADIVKASKRFRRRRKNIDSMNHTQIWGIDCECEENMDWRYMHEFCLRCRANGFECYEDYLIRVKCRVDECAYCGRDLTDSDYDPNFCCIHCS